jgi:hypothetical protein
MATTSTTETAPKEPATKDVGSGSVTSEDIETIKTDPRFSLPVRTVTTAEDAVQAYLREEITEAELRTVCAAYGYNLNVTSPMLAKDDASYKRDIPEDLYVDNNVSNVSVEDRLKAVEERDKEAAKATKAAEDAKVDPSLDPTVKGNIENQAAAKALAEDTSSK